MSYSFFFHFALVYLYLHSFPTRRSSDLPILQRSLVLILLRARRGPSSSFSSSFLPPPWAESPLARWLRACSPQALVPVTTRVVALFTCAFGQRNAGAMLQARVLSPARRGCLPMPECSASRSANTLTYTLCHR